MALLYIIVKNISYYCYYNIIRRPSELYFPALNSYLVKHKEFLVAIFKILMIGKNSLFSSRITRTENFLDKTGT